MPFAWVLDRRKIGGAQMPDLRELPAGEAIEVLEGSKSPLVLAK